MEGRLVLEITARGVSRRAVRATDRADERRLLSFYSDLAPWIDRLDGAARRIAAHKHELKAFPLPQTARDRKHQRPPGAKPDRSRPASGTKTRTDAPDRAR